MRSEVGYQIEYIFGEMFMLIEFYYSLKMQVVYCIFDGIAL